MIQWRDCITGTISSQSIPENWIDIAYTGSEGGVCYEPLYLEFSETALNFSATDGVVNTIPEVKKITIRNTSSVNKYNITLNTENTIFTLSTNTIELLPNQTQTFTIELPPNNTKHFNPGTTQMNLTLSVVVTKLT